MVDTFSKYRFASAKKFLAALRPSDSRWLKKGWWHITWAFRGQRNANWGLLPSVWRDDIVQHPHYKMYLDNEANRDVSSIEGQLRKLFIGSDRNGDELQTEHRDREWERRRERILVNARRLYGHQKFEFGVVRQFTEMADQLGLVIPGRPFSRTASVSVPLGPGFENEDQPFDPVVAIAQHHGMPTRLLDWSTNPMVAAFMATEGVTDKMRGDIAVWALNIRELARRDSDIRPFTIARSESAYLHAQDGLFTFIRGGNIDFVLSGIWPNHEQEAPKGALVQLQLPISEVPELRRLLHVEGVHLARLMPTHDNISQMLKANWERGGFA